MAVVTNFSLANYAVIDVLAYVVTRYDIYKAKEHSLTLKTSDGYSVTFLSSNLEYDGTNQLVGGNVTEIDFTFRKQPLAEITGLNENVVELFDSFRALAIGDLRPFQKITTTIPYEYEGAPVDDFFFGGGRDDQIDGGAGDDTLAGSKGDDELKGGQGSDTFLYTVNWGDDTILDFKPGRDHVYFDDVRNGVRSFSQIERDRDADGNAVAVFNGSSITFDGLTWNDLDHNDFGL